MLIRSPNGAGENIAWISIETLTPAQTVGMWMSEERELSRPETDGGTMCWLEVMADLQRCIRGARRGISVSPASGETVGGDRVPRERMRAERPGL